MGHAHDPRGPGLGGGLLRQLERAAGLLGAGAALSHELGITLFPYALLHHDACEATVRAGLDEARYRSAWDRGYGLARDQVAAVALEETAGAGRDAPAAAPAHEGEAELSARELEVARLAAQGLSNPAIAADLFVSVATVKTHVSHILGKPRPAVPRAARRLGRRARLRPSGREPPLGEPDHPLRIGHLADARAPADNDHAPVPTDPILRGAIA